MKIEWGKISYKQERPRLLWLLLSAALLLALWEAPLVSMAHRQLGTRAFLRGAFQTESSTDLSRPIALKAEDLDAAEYHLAQANGESGTLQPALDTYRTLGVAELAAGDLASAQQWLVRRLETAPDDVLARYFLGETHLRMGDTMAAIKHWEMAGADHQLVRLAEDLAQGGASAEALKVLDVVMRQNASDVESRWRAAEIWKEQGDTERALALYEEIIVIDPQITWARRLAAWIWIERGNAERALALSQEIIAIAPQLPDGYAVAGELFFNEGQYERAIALFEQALERYPASPHWMLLRLGRAHAALGRWSNAIDAYERAIHGDPTHHPVFMLMGDAKCQVGRPEEARFYYERAISLGNQNDYVRRAPDYIAQHGDCPPP